ncbi:MAG TPA: erythromycin biosynthesis sensory transduction protein eryC1 [Blastocatellia bacterium]|nr:erythromycin biosynthesis sensory transduction protein eryC1 [Blastocatellia bacterium]
MILCANPRAQYLAQQAEIDAAIARVLNNGRYILGEEEQAFEEEFSAYVGVPYGVGVGSGTDALYLALAACQIGEGDEVITVSHTAVATVAAIELAGATPVLIDIERDFFTLDPNKLEAAITSRTKAIIPVHIYGQPADLDPILDIATRHNLRVIEDCAQAHGAIYKGTRVGARGDIGCFSFYPTKNLGAIGDGGMIVTKDAALAERARLLREYGWAERYVSHIPGGNSRLDELQAAILRAKLRTLDDSNQKRIGIAQQYNECLSDNGLILPRMREDTTHVFHLYVVRVPERHMAQEYLQSRDVNTLVHYPVPVHLQPAYHHRLRVPAQMRETESAAQEILSLPMYPELSQENTQQVIDNLRSFMLARQPVN